MRGMAFRLKVEEAVLKIAVTVPRDICISTTSRDRRTQRAFDGPEHVARAIVDEGNGLIFVAEQEGTKLRAREVLKQATANVAARLPGASPDPATVTVSDYAPTWLTTVKGSTRDSYEGMYRRQIEHRFGALALSEVRPRLVRGWLHELEREGLEPATVKLYFRALSSLLTQAARDEEIDRNPIRTLLSAGSKGKKKRRRRCRALTAQQRGAIIRALRDSEPSDDKRLAIEVLAATGCRAGEALGLRWGDLRGRELVIERQVYKGKVVTPKNGKTRQVVLSESMVARLRRHRVAQQKAALSRGRRAGPWMFQGTTGRHLSYATVRNSWLAALRLVGLMPEDEADQDMRSRELNPHVLRHTYATLLLGQGRDLAKVAEQLGQHPSTTMSYYWHAIPKDRDDLAVDLDAEIRG